MAYGYPQQIAAGGLPSYTPYRGAPQYTQTPSWSPLAQVRPVTSLEEVKASPIEFDGSIFYFPDFANKKIYTKFINMDGTVAINMYELKEVNADQTTNNNYVTRQEFDSAINQLKTMFDSNSANVAQPAAQPIYNF